MIFGLAEELNFSSVTLEVALAGINGGMVDYIESGIQNIPLSKPGSSYVPNTKGDSNINI